MILFYEQYKLATITISNNIKKMYIKRIIIEIK